MKTSGKSNFTPAPAGTDQAVCCDVVDLGLVKTVYQNKERLTHRVRIVWELKTTNEETGKPFMASRGFTNSIHPKSSMGPFLEQWRGKAFTEDEINEFEMDTIIGANCLLSIVHKPAPGSGVYANVTGAAPLLKGMPKIFVSASYVRQKDRPDWVEPKSEQTGQVFHESGEQDEPESADQSYQAVDEDIPF